MRKDKQTFKVLGMAQDECVSSENNIKGNPDKAYEIRNMRFSSSDFDNSLVLNNEQGTQEVLVNDMYELDGIPLGTATVGKYLIVFTKSDSFDYIYRLEKIEDNRFKADVIAKGYFNFEDRIETISYYENEKVLKVYWIDGKNCLRVMNILSDKIIDSSKMIDSVPICVQDNIGIDINKQYDASGVFSPGTIQYFFTYANKYLAESNVFYQSALFYCNSNEKNGVSPEDTATCSFRIKLTGLDNDYEYLNCYSVSRSTTDGTPNVKIVKQLRIPENGEIEFVDTNMNSVSVDFTELSSHTNVALIPDTFAVKANTMFIGNVRYDNEEITLTHDDFKNAFKDHHFYLKQDQYNVKLKGYYPHVNQMTKDNRHATTFKTRETYRFGVQFQHKRGYWSETFWLGDYGNGVDDAVVYPKINQDGYNGTIDLPAFKGTLDKSVIKEMIDNGFVKARPVIVYPTENDREVLYQGIVNPTMFNYGKRNGNNIFSQASWFFRPESRTSAISDNNTGNFSIQQKPVDPKKKQEVILQYEHYRCLPDNTNYNAEIQCNLYHTPNFNSVFFNKNDAEAKRKNDTFFQDSFFVDRSIFTFNSPELDIEQKLAHGQRLGYKFRIVGAIKIDSSVGGYRVINPNVTNTFRDDPFSLARGLNDGDIFQYINSVDDYYPGSPLASFIMWSDEMTNPSDGIKNPSGDENSNRQYYEYGFLTYPWHRDGCLNNNALVHDETASGGFKSKILANMRYSIDTKYMNEPIDVDLEDTISWNDMTDNPVGLYVDNEVKLYSGSVDDVIHYGIGDYAGGQLDDRNVVKATINSCDPFWKYLAFGDAVGGFHFLSIRTYIRKVKAVTEAQANDISGNDTPLFYVYCIKVGNDYRYILDATNRGGHFIKYTWDDFYDDGIEDHWDDTNKDNGSQTYQFSGVGDKCCFYISYNDSGIDLATTARGGVYARVELQYAEGKNVKLRILGRSSQGGNRKHKESFTIYLTAREISSKQMGYPIVCTGPNKVEDNPYDDFLKPANAALVDNNGFKWNYSTGREAVIMRYSSNPHLVSSIKSEGLIQNILPSIKSMLNIEDYVFDDDEIEYEIPEINYDNDPKFDEILSNHGLTKDTLKNADEATIEQIQNEWNAYVESKQTTSNEGSSTVPTQNSQTIHKEVVMSPFWDINKKISSCKPIGKLREFVDDLGESYMTSPIMLIGEYYKVNDNKFGGTSQESLETNIWCVGGESVSLYEDQDVELNWTEGDTYYQRYDCVKTLPYNQDDRNQIVEMMSCMIETRINLDGRYDTKQGVADNTILTKDNVNKINKAYTQTDNLFTYTAFTDDDINADEFHNDIFWSDKKVNGEKVDKWTNINVMNSISSDNIYGRLVKLVSNGVGLYALNEGSISKILYNETASVNDDNGNSVLFGINDAVNGIQVINNSYGCQNKWSVVDYEDMVLWVDNNAKSHLAISNDKVSEISNVLGMKSWFAKNNVYGSSYFDKVNREVMYITDDDCLMFGSVRGSGTYTGFFDYGSSMFENYLGDGIFVTSDGSNTRLWLKNKGEYNHFFNERRNYSVTYKVNDYSTVQKLFTNVEFRSSTSIGGEDINDTFDILRCWNEYQDTLDDKIVFERYIPSDIKRKFRIWRANIGRHKNQAGLRYNLDRINSTWAFVKIEKSNADIEKTILNDFEVVYYACNDTTFNAKAQNDQNERLQQLYKGDI